jgi:hypothetical protein
MILFRRNVEVVFCTRKINNPVKMLSANMRHPYCDGKLRGDDIIQGQAVLDILDPPNNKK